MLSVRLAWGKAFSAGRNRPARKNATKVLEDAIADNLAGIFQTWATDR